MAEYTQTNPQFLIALSNLARRAESQVYIRRLGRPRVPVRDIVFASVLKVYTEAPARALVPLLKDAHRDGLITSVPHYNSILRYLNEEDSRKQLVGMIICCLSAQPSGVKRKHKRIRFASGLRFFGRNYRTLVNEMLCAKICELLTKLIWYGGTDTIAPQPFAGSDNILMRSIEAVIPSGLSPDVKDDLFQELAIAVLDGTESLDALRNRVNKYLSRARAFAPSWSMLSLDAPLHEDGSRTLGETIV